MDESVRLFEEEQRRLAQSVEPAHQLGKSLLRRMISFAAVAGGMWSLMVVIGYMPRNADNSVKFAYFGPVIAMVGACSGLLLRGRAFRRSPFAWSAWGLIAFALIAIPAGFYDAVTRHGS